MEDIEFESSMPEKVMIETPKHGRIACAENLVNQTEHTGLTPLLERTTLSPPKANRVFRVGMLSSQATNKSKLGKRGSIPQSPSTPDLCLGFSSLELHSPVPEICHAKDSITDQYNETCTLQTKINRLRVQSPLNNKLHSDSENSDTSDQDKFDNPDEMNITERAIPNSRLLSNVLTKSPSDNLSPISQCLLIPEARKQWMRRMARLDL